MHRLFILATLVLWAATAHAGAVTAAATGADLDILRETFVQAEKAAELGDHPFVAMLADAKGKILLKSSDQDGPAGCLSHAVLLLCREACGRLQPEELARATLYTNVEPCPMCAAALVNTGIGHVVWGLSRQRLHAMVPEPQHPRIDLSARDVLDRATVEIKVTGPLLEDEAAGPVTVFMKRQAN